jgi:hypothetical protein
VSRTDASEGERCVLHQPLGEMKLDGRDHAEGVKRAASQSSDDIIQNSTGVRVDIV